MRERLGWLTFALAIAFALALVGTLAGVAWIGFSWAKGWIGFFGFGIPMVLCGAATFGLWVDSPRLLQILGWVATEFGLLNGASIFLFVVSLVIGFPSASQSPSLRPNSLKTNSTANDLDANWSAFWSGLGVFLGFGSNMLVCGGFGIALIVESERRKVFIQAISENDARTKAEADNPGWKAFSAVTQIEGSWEVHLRPN